MITDRLFSTNPPALTAALLLCSAICIASSCGLTGTAGGSPDPRCTELEKQYDAVLDAANGACARDTDCACYNSVSKKSRCGGITDGKSAEKLAKIAREFHDRRCPLHYRCAPWRCVPACYQGKCVSGALRRTMEKP